MDIDDKAFLGRGWAFPPSFDPGVGVELVTAETDILQSLQILLSTFLGERVMQPTYGCNLQDYVFEPLSATIASSIKEQIRTAILYHEPRILLNRLDLTMDEELQGRANFTIDYTILNTNSRFNIVYPFYLQEGTGNLLPGSVGAGNVLSAQAASVLLKAGS
ncbi:GPW/gp25 family protein [Pseudanabaenaceae cyanobacterium LEGE 13415]|nr:GPW/gp25 family protein [Pseudanabaenaceae cyanobacterium LEGE 13415]